MRWWLALLLGAVVLPAGAQTDGPVLLDEGFTNNARQWRVDSFSRFDDGGYLIDARGQGGFYRWVDDPGNLRDFILRVEVAKRRGPGTGPLFGVIFRIQDSWRNCYFFCLNGAGGYAFGKFRQGSATILKQGSDPAIKTGAEVNKLTVRAEGSLFGLSVNGAPLANVQDDTFPGGGRVGLCAEAPVAAWFDNLSVCALAAGGGGAHPLAGPRVLFQDDFTEPNGWAEDAYRVRRDGAYHLQNRGESTSFVSWQPKTAGLKDFDARIDARLVSGQAKTLYGLVWRLQDGSHYDFFLVGADGRFFAGVVEGTETRVQRKGRQMAIRGTGEVNTLFVRARGDQFVCGVNDVETCSFKDTTFATGSLGVYLEQPGDVAFDQVRVTEPAESAPPVIGAAGGASWPAGPLRLHESLAAEQGYGWPVDKDHLYDQGGYCLRAPAQGSRTVIHEQTLRRTDGVYTVNARAYQGNLSGSYGLVVRADKAMTSFVYVLMNAAGRYFVGRCKGNRFESLDSGPIAELRGGDAGNELEVTVAGSVISYGVNGQRLGQVTIDQPTAGAVGLHAENGVVACFRDLRVFDLPREGTR